MRVSTKGRYALRVMLDLAEHKEDGFLSLKEVSDRQGISMKYLEMIVSTLHKAGFLNSQRGKAGGYKLARDSKEYTIGSILKLTEGSLAPVKCLDAESEKCERAAECITLPLWVKLDDMIDGYLEGITLDDLMKGEV